MITGPDIVKRKLWNKTVGSFAHKLIVDPDHEYFGLAQFQVEVLAVKGKRMWVQYFSAWDGEPTDKGWVSQLELDAWVFYDSESEWRRRFTNDSATMRKRNERARAA